MSPTVTLALKLILGITLAEASYLLLKRWLTNSEQDPPKLESRVLFFSQRVLQTCRACRLGKACSEHENELAQLIMVLREAKTSLDVCIFTLSSEELTTVILEMYEKGVRVRFITDYEQESLKGSTVYKIRQAGISVRADRSPFLMHHKFAVIDKHTLLSGSFNWTRNAAMGNSENVVVSREAPLVTAFTEEFQRLWEYFTSKDIAHSSASA